MAAAARKSRRSAGIDLSQHAWKNTGVEERDRLDREQVKVIDHPSAHEDTAIVDAEWSCLVFSVLAVFATSTPKSKCNISGCSRHQRIAWQTATRHSNGKHSCMTDWSLASTMMRMSCTMWILCGKAPWMTSAKAWGHLLVLKGPSAKTQGHMLPMTVPMKRRRKEV